MPGWLAGLGIVAGLGAGVGAALGGYAVFHEPYRVRTEELSLQLLRPRAGLPQEGLRILHISDTHFRGADRRERAKIAQVRQIAAERPFDLLIHTGDFLHNDNGLGNLLALMDCLPRPRLGSFAVLGNHDYVVYEMKRALRYTWQNFSAREARRGHLSAPDVRPSRRARASLFMRFVRHLLYNRIDGEPTGVNDIARLRFELEKRGVQFLHNQAVRLAGTGVYLAGVEDIQEGQPDLTSALGTVPGHAPTILLSHNPDILQAPAANQADLILAGHTHGGQVVLPLVGPAHTQSVYLSRREASGYLRRGKTHVYIHRGLGEGVPIRFGAPPHVTFLRVLPPAQEPGRGVQLRAQSL